MANEGNMIRLGGLWQNEKNGQSLPRGQPRRGADSDLREQPCEGRKRSDPHSLPGAAAEARRGQWCLKVGILAIRSDRNAESLRIVQQCGRLGQRRLSAVLSDGSFIGLTS